MQSLKTSITSEKIPESISYGQKILTIGSCFADVIGEKLLQSKFDALVNPFGVVFNPFSLFNLLINGKAAPELFVQRDGVTCHHNYHFQLRDSNESKLAHRISHIHEQVNEALSKSDWLMVTFGSAFVYELVSQKAIVSNCHKVPSTQFRKRLLDLHEMERTCLEAIEKLKSINPSLKVLLTVSPVRHTKDGLAENQLSKSLLRVLCNQLTKHDDVFYFPAYEIMVDDLRDYRFYKDDLIHPSSLAENYIWEIFKKTVFSEKTSLIIEGWYKLLKAIHHLPFNPNSMAHQKFLNRSIGQLEGFKEYFDTSAEEEMLKNQLISD